MCNILRIINLKENTMFKFEDQQKQFQEVLDRTQAAYDFWTKAVFTTAKEFFKVK
jgi:hypothetical protein